MALGLLLAAASCHDGGGSANGAPSLTTSLGPSPVVNVSALLEFDVQVSDPDGDPVSLTLLDPPPGCVMSPAREVRSPLTCSIRWLVLRGTAGLVHLVFRAEDEASHVSTLDIAVNVQGQSAGLETPTCSQVLVGDVTGDGLLDVVAGASHASIGSASDAGAVYVWPGATAPLGYPAATLTVPGAQDMDELGVMTDYSYGKRVQGIQLGDVTGDGVLDVVVGATNADEALGPSTCGPGARRSPRLPPRP